MPRHTAELLSQLQHADGVLVSVDSVQGSGPREVGAWMAVFPQTLVNTIGGGHLEFQAITEARALLQRPASENAPSTATHEGFEPCMLSLDGEDDRRIQVTQAFTSKFVEIARGLQIDIERDIITGKLIIDNIDDDTLALFPNLEYIVEGDNGMAVHIGTLQPHEYTTREENQQNKVTVLLNDDPSICFLNSGIFKGLALHFDMAHNRLGFADSF